MTTAVFPAGLYRTAVHPTVVAGPRRWDPTWLVGVYIVVLLAVPSPLQIEPLGAAGGPANIMGLVALSWWACARFLPGGMAWGFSPIRWVIVAFMAAMVCGFATAALRPLDAIAGSGADRTLMSLLGFAGIALLAADGIGTLDQLHRTVRRLVDVAACFALAGILQFYMAIDVARYIRFPGLTSAVPTAEEFALQHRSGLPRVVATSSHPIEYGVVLAVALPLAFHLALTAADNERLTRWACVSLIGFAAPLALARSAVLGLTVGMVALWCGWGWQRRKTALGVAIVYLVLARLLVGGLLGAIRNMFLNMADDPSYQGRTMDYVVVGEMVGDAPWVGQGLGTFNPELYFILDHQYLGTLIETGVVGLAGLCALFLVGLFTARGVRRYGRAMGDGRLDSLGLALAASMLVLITTFVTFDALAFRMVAGLLFVLLGVIGAAWRLARVGSDPAARPPRPSRTTRSIPSTRTVPA